MITGKIAIQKGGADLPRLGLHLEEIQLTAENYNGDSLDLEGHIQSGFGSIDIKGNVDIQPALGFPSAFKIQGTSFEMINLPEAWVIASPDLEVAFKGDTINVEGEVIIPRANIEPLEFSGSVPISKDVVIVTEGEKEISVEKRKLYSKVRLTLGEKVAFNGFGLRGNITGSLLAIDTPGKLTTGQGELEVLEGKYKAYGQKLQIERGRLLFAGGPIDDPGLDVKAIRKSGDITSGVYVRGTLKNPQMELFSSPTLDQTDALSYLVLGRPTDQATGEEGQELHNAAMSLGLGGGGFLAEQVGETFGIEEVDIEAGSTADEATLFIGKYLSPRLYISYGIGLFEPVSTLRIRYQISSKWMVQTEYGIESGADLIYKIER
jgi:translocation and assembly module TamB